ncbi:hypothetical protein [Shewanella litorisediminis]|uniref:Phospholipase C n=1 Tax=Shewanella litorisediminis TaxID=1173586 RepID=A0ABX7G1E9_9GAMM|nr:hypothetical protein [Shewanella litorisediminis]MCL2920194.1 hypothetical protein [Shewanella litorisediminis]QRH01149.1 hypothetical protein JQC75_14990 [Shewanella litorisediminis]
MIKYLFALLTLLAFSANGYHPKEAHQPLTTLAVDAMSQCGMSLTESTRLQLMQGNLAMDEGAGKLPRELMESAFAKAVFPMTKRLHNWHFYHPDKTADGQRLAGKTDMSMARLWQAALTGLEQAPAEHKAYYLGALIHLIQDLTVPAHAVPVYHGPKIIAWQREFAPLVNYLGLGFRGIFVIHDPVDDWPVSPQGAEYGIAAIPCPEPHIAASARSANFDALRTQVARQTLAALDTPIPGCAAPWRLFWSEDIGHRYFAGYKQGIKPFGRAKSLSGDGISIDGRPCEPDYQGFVAARHRAAVEATMAALQLSRLGVSEPASSAAE